ncbi:MAG: hypothetical protein J6K74_01075 [Marinifilaceae bacterium]|nr:hypothetical protein [Marinifilaceae bacterium]
MNKKLLSCICAVSALFATSCSNDEKYNAEDGIVTFNIERPESVSRAYGDGETANTLYYAVYDEQGNELTELRGVVENFFMRTSVTLKLVAGDTYSLIFWAAHEDAPYTIDWTAKTMTVNYDGIEANDETLDAFWNIVEPFKVKTTADIDVDLYRPFAQLNVFTKDTEDARKSGLVVAETQISAPVYTTLNLWTGEVSDQQKRTFNYTAHATGTMVIKGETYDYLTMNYLLVAEDPELVEMTFYYNEDETTTYSRDFGSVPVERNYKTNIYGELLTKGIDFNVEIIPDFLKPDKEYGVANNETTVTPENIGTMMFDADNTTYNFVGAFTGEIVIKAAAGKIQVFNGSDATFDSHIKFTAGRIADNTVDITKERTGSYTLTGFSTPNSISVGANAVNSLTVADCEAYTMDFNTSNTDVTLSNNTIVRPATAEESYVRYDGGQNKNVIYFYSDNYSLTMLNNTISDEKGAGNCLQLLGNYEQFQSNVTWTTSIDMRGNNISNTGKHPLVKIYNDPTYAPVAWPTDYEISEAAETLANQIVNENTISYVDCPLEVLCRATGKADANIKLYGNSVQYNKTDGIYAVGSAEGLRYIAETISSPNIELTGDIYLTEDWTPIAKKHGVTQDFKMTLDGKGYTIYNMNINAADSKDQGLFSKAAGTIKNLNFANVTGTAKGRLGVIAGQYSGTIENCTVTGATLSVSEDRVGGLVGLSYDCNIVGCTLTELNLTATDGHAGGLIGTISGGAKDSYTNNTISGTIASGNGADAGALYGGNAGGTFTESDNDATGVVIE